jgi:hypothetical protein
MHGYSSIAYIGSTPRLIKCLFVTFALAIRDVFHIGVRVVTKLEYAGAFLSTAVTKRR